MKTNTEVEKEFDEKFFHKGNVSIVNVVTGKRKYAPLNHLMFTPNRVKSFILSTLDERMDEIVEWAKSRKGLFKNDFGDGYEAMIKDLIAHLGMIEPTSTKGSKEDW